MIAIIIGIDHGYYAIKTRQVSFPSGIIRYDYEPYTMQNVLQYQGKYYVCGTGRQTLVKNKTSNDNYYLLTLAAIAEEIKHRKDRGNAGCRTSTFKFWKRETGIQGVSVAERAASAIFI